MIEKLIKFSVQNRLAVSFMVFVLIIWGTYSLSKLPIDAVPDVTGIQIDVITNSPSLAPLEIERFITAPIEMEMSNIPNLVEMRSISKFGLSVVKMVFKDETDIYWARQQVFERLKNVENEIPEELGKPVMGPVSTGLGEVYQYVIRHKNPKDNSYSLPEIRTLQDWVVRRQLLGTPGIAEVSSFGGYKKEYRASIRSERMRSLGVTIDDLYDALSKGNANTGGAYIEKNGKAYTIRGVGLASTIEEIGNTVIKNNVNVPVLVKDVADVDFGNSIRYGAMTMDGNGEVVGGVIMMMKGENGQALIKRLKVKIAEIQKTLPEGLEIVAFYDREKIVSQAIGTVAKNLIEGALIVVLVIIVFLGNWRASILAASVIPLSMLFAFGMMKYLGVVGNLMSLGAIDFGLLVDPAIIIVESVVLFLGLAMVKKASGTEMSYLERQDAVIDAASDVKQSVVYGGLIILVVYVPILALEGIEGKMFIPMAQTVSFAILGALFLAITYVPMMSAWIIKPPKSLEHHGPSEVIVQFLYKGYAPLIKWFMNKKTIAITLAFFVLISGSYTFTKIGGEFIPKLSEGDYNIEIMLPVGSSLTESINLSNRIQVRLKKEFPDEMIRMVSKIGTAEVPVDPKPLEAQEIVIVLSDKSTWKKAKNQQELSLLIAKVMEDFPGIVISIQQPIENRVNEMMSGAKTDVVVKIFGKDLDTLALKAKQIKTIIKSVKGAADVVDTKIFGLPQIDIKYDRQYMSNYGVKVDQINRAIQSAYAGVTTGTVYENDKRFDLTIRLSKEDRDKSESIGNLLVSDKNQNPIPLKELSEIKESVGPTQIDHENLKRKVNIGFNVRGRDLQSVVSECMIKIKEKVSIPKGYTVDFGGSFENMNQAKSRLAIVLPIALLIIFGLLFATFGSVKDSLLIFTVVPLSAMGGVFSLALRDMNFSISAGVGFIALFGIAVLNGILLVSHFNFLKNKNEKPLEESVLQGLGEKFRPVLMTSMVAALGFLPMALSSSVGAEVQKPLATVVIGGLFTATILTLIVLPILYILFNKKSKNAQ